MFDFFRKFNKAFMVLLFLLIVPSFAMFGVSQYNQVASTGEVVASVGGNDITRPEWDAQHRIESDRARQQNPNVDPTLLDTDTARYASLEMLVRERLLTTATAKSKLAVSDAELARVFSADASLAGFRDEKGGFDRARFVAATGRTPDQYEALVRAQLSQRQLLSGVSATAFVPKALADTTIDAFYARREIQVATFNLNAYTSKVTPTDAELDAYFKAHAADFQAPERASVEYVLLDIATIKKNMVVSDDELKKYYDGNKDRLGTKEERRASHILLAAPKSASSGERDKARATAEQLLAQVKKDPASFAVVARKSSQDPGSAEKGGDLDFVARGAMVKPFDDAMFAMKKADISDIVESDFGFHIIQLNDIKPAVIPPFEQVRATVDGEVRAQRATSDFASAADQLKSLVYDQPDSLKPAADQLKLVIQNSNLGRTPAPGTVGVLGSRNFLKAMFTPESLERKRNSEAVDIGPSQLAVGRVTQYVPAHAMAFAEVKEQIRSKLVADGASKLAKAEGAAQLASWQADMTKPAAALGAPVTVSRLELQNQPPMAIEAALRLDPSKLPAMIGVDLGIVGYAVVRVNKVVPRVVPTGDAAKQEADQIKQAFSGAETEAYYKFLRDRFKVKILVKNPSAVAASS